MRNKFRAPKIVATARGAFGVRELVTVFRRHVPHESAGKPEALHTLREIPVAAAVSDTIGAEGNAFILSGCCRDGRAPRVASSADSFASHLAGWPHVIRKRHPIGRSGQHGPVPHNTLGAWRCCREIRGQNYENYRRNRMEPDAPTKQAAGSMWAFRRFGSKPEPVAHPRFDHRYLMRSEPAQKSLGFHGRYRDRILN